MNWSYNVEKKKEFITYLMAILASESLDIN